jgi:sugar lactone lactonase YvrE
MTLEKLGAGIDFVQDATPPASDAIDGDVYLDTSLSPPQVKVFDASIGSFVRPQTAQNLDQKVSTAGADLVFRGGFQLALADFTLSFDVSGEASNPQGVAFNGDGTTMVVVESSSDSAHQYSLSSGFDLSTASFTGTSFSLRGQADSPQDVAFNGDGTTMLVMGGNNDSVFQYSLSSGFDVGTASFTGTSFDVSGQEDGPQGVAFNGDGTTMVVAGNNSDSVHRYSLSSGFDVGTASFTGFSFDVSGQASNPTGVAFNGDGTAMFVTGNNSDSVHQYSLSSGFDVDTASFTGTSFNVKEQAENPQGVAFNGDGTTMVVAGSSSDSVHQYLVGTVGPK